MITIFDLGKDNSNKSLAHSIRSYMQSNKDREVTIHYSNDTDIKDCIGCWSCWWKSPGKCALKDEAFKLYKDYINSDEVVILFDTENGFIDSKGKTFIDRLIQKNIKCGQQILLVLKTIYLFFPFMFMLCRVR